MSKISRVRIRFFVTWSVHRVVFLPIFLFYIILFCWLLCCLCCFKWLSSVFLCACVCCLQVVISMQQLWCERCPHSFLDTHSLSVSSQGCKVLCLVSSLLVLWSICLSSSLVHFQNPRGFLTSRAAKMLLPLMRLLLFNMVLDSVLVLLRYSFFIFSFISTCLMVSTSNIS